MYITRRPEGPYIYFINLENCNLQITVLMKTLLLQTRVDNQENQNEGEVPDKKIVGFEKSKKNHWLQASAIKLLGVNNKTPNAFFR